MKVQVKWDTDGFDVCLPSEVDVPDDVVYADHEGDALLDYLTDKYEYCVESYCY